MERKRPEDTGDRCAFCNQQPGVLRYLPIPATRICIACLNEVEAITEQVPELIGAAPTGTKHALVQRFIPMSRLIAERINAEHQGAYDLEDLVADGHIGLLSAADRYKNTPQGNFGAYAIWYIRRSILENLPQLPKRRLK